MVGVKQAVWRAALARLAVVLALLSGSAVTVAEAQSQGPPSLGVQGQYFTVNGEAKFLTFLSYFDALRATDLAADLAFIGDQAEFDGIRVFPNWWVYAPGGAPGATGAADTLFDDQGNIRGDTVPASGPLQRLLAVLQAAKQQRLVVDLSFARETVPGSLSVPNCRKALKRIAYLLRGHRHVLFDIQNERDSANPAMFLSAADVAEIRAAIKHPTEGDATRLVMASSGAPAVGPGGLTDPAGAAGFTLTAGLDVLASHDPRVVGWEDDTTAQVAALQPANLPIYLQEPTRWRMTENACGEAETTTQSDDDPAHFREALQRAKAAGAAAWTFHTQRAFRLATAGPLHQQILDLPAGDPERELYVGAARLTVTPGAWQRPLDVTVAVTGPGQVTLNGSVCTEAGGASCRLTAAPGDSVTIAAQPDTGQGARFDGWDMLVAEGGTPCAGPSCQVTIRADTDIGARFTVPPSEAFEFYHLDAAGSVRLVTNESGAVTTRNELLPFGEIFATPTTPDPLATRLVFGAKERDAESGFDYFGARFLRPESGRFTSVDPVMDAPGAISNPQRWNRYAYVSNNPLRRLDPNGLYEVDVHQYLTAVLSRAAGLSAKLATEIAKGNQGVDDSILTSPLLAPWKLDEHHFTTDHVRRALWKAFEHSGSTADLGTFLHAHQDSYSHAGYYPIPGHARDGHAPDKTFLRPDLADRMAESSFKHLQAAAVRLNGRTLDVSWNDISPYVQRFNRARTVDEKRTALNSLMGFIHERELPQ